MAADGCDAVLFVLVCGLEGAGRGKQREHTVRAGAIHASVVNNQEREMRRRLAENQGQRDAPRDGDEDGE